MFNFICVYIYESRENITVGSSKELVSSLTLSQLILVILVLSS